MERDQSSVTDWIHAASAGDPAAGQKIWEHYVERLVRLARKALGDAPRRVADQDDVAIRAFDAFLRGAREGRFAKLDDRDDLWQVLVMLTERRAVDQRRHESVRRRKVLGESAFERRGSDNSSAPRLANRSSPEATPAFAAAMRESCHRLLEILGDQSLVAIALWKMEGYTNGEISHRIGCVRRTVDRKLALIRDRWKTKVPKETNRGN